jgi:spoIIIJ-associated protein
MTDQVQPTDDTAPEDPALASAHAELAALLTQMEVHAQVAASWGPEDDEDGTRPLLLDIHGDDLGMLIGRQGETLSALQYLLRLMLWKKLGEDVNVIVDVENHKRRRAEQLRRLAQRMADQAMQRQRVMTLEPMPAHERRLIHLELRNHPLVRTESVGEGTRRKVTIIPK